MLLWNFCCSAHFGALIMSWARLLPLLLPLLLPFDPARIQHSGLWTQNANLSPACRCHRYWAVSYVLYPVCCWPPAPKPHPLSHWPACPAAAAAACMSLQFVLPFGICAFYMCKPSVVMERRNFVILFNIQHSTAFALHVYFIILIPTFPTLFYPFVWWALITEKLN